MRVLGAVLAGGRSRRFGSDKALASLGNETLLAHVLRLLTAQTDAVVVCGRELPGVTCLPDRPAPDLGPLGGLAAALHHGQRHGFDAVLSAPCDTPDLPSTLRVDLVPHAPSFVADQPVIGLWPCALAEVLDEHLDKRRLSLRSWVERIGANAIPPTMPLANINTTADLAAWHAGAGIEREITSDALRFQAGDQRRHH